jgi:hypothetical protein
VADLGRGTVAKRLFSQLREGGPAVALLPHVRRFGLLALLALATRAAGFARPLWSGDEATYSALAVRLLGGALPYRSAVDHKPPGIVLLYALVYAAAGPWRLVWVRLAAILAVAATGLVLSAAARRLDLGGSAWVGPLYVLASAVGLPGDVQTANTELFLNLPLALAMLLAAGRGRRAPAAFAAAGALVALAALFRYQAALALLAFPAAAVASPLCSRARALRLLALLGGFGAVWAAVLSTLAALGVWEAFCFWGWHFNFRYMAAITLGEAARAALISTALVASCWSPLLVALALRPRRAPPLVVAWLAAMLMAVIPGGRFFPHYFLMALPPLALLAGPSLEALVGQGGRGRLLLTALFGMLLLAAMAASWTWSRLRDGLAWHEAVYGEVARWIDARSGADETIFVWGNSPLYFHAARRPATRFVFCNYLTGKIWGTRLNDDPLAEGSERQVVPRAWSELLADLAAAPPRFIVDESAAGLGGYGAHPIARYPALARFVAARYRLVAAPAGVPIYQRMEPSSAVSGRQPLEHLAAVVLDGRHQPALALQGPSDGALRAGRELPAPGAHSPGRQVHLDLGALIRKPVEFVVGDHQIGQRLVDEVALMDEGKAPGQHRANARPLQRPHRLLA